MLAGMKEKRKTLVTNKLHHQALVLTPITLATQEAEIRRTVDQSQPGK
jgi:hypothetical protein